MSDRETSPSPQENGSQHSDERSPSPQGSRSPADNDERRRSRSPRSKSHSRSRSRSYSRSYSRRRRSHTRSRSHSRSRRHRRHHYSRSRSRSPKYHKYDRYRDYYRSRSRSPMSGRRRHLGNRDNPQPSRCLGVFGLSLYTQECDLRDVFLKYGPLQDVQVVYDAQTGRSRGFSFVYFENVEDAKLAKERCNGQEIDGRKIRVDYSITQRAHTPTPGIYMGKPTYPRYGGGGGGGGGRGSGGGYRNRSPSPYNSRNSRRYSRSRSRSYSPRKYGYY